jgi:hypothetical protein
MFIHVRLKIFLEANRAKQGEITLYPPEVSTHFHFCLQSLKCDTLPPPPKLSNCGNLTHLTYLFPKCPQHFFFSKKKKIPKKKKTKKIYKYMLGWPNHPIGGGQPPRFLFFGFFFFFF